jgi:hypothetical protein
VSGFFNGRFPLPEQLVQSAPSRHPASNPGLKPGATSMALADALGVPGPGFPRIGLAEPAKVMRAPLLNEHRWRVYTALFAALITPL